MKQRFPITALTWSSNIILTLIALGLVVLIGFLLFVNESPIPDAKEYEGALSLSISSTATFFNRHYIYEFHKSDGETAENIYYINPNRIFTFSESDSVMATLQVLNESLSSEKQWLGGAVKQSTRVYTSSTTVPLRVGHPGIPISRETFDRVFVMSFVTLFIQGIFIFIFFWYLRKFILGLRTNDFFSTKNLGNLKTTSLILIVYPLIIFLVQKIGFPKITDIYNAKVLNTVSLDFGFIYIVFGLTLWVVSIVFQKGIELQNDQEFTI